MRDEQKQTPQDVCGEASIKLVEWPPRSEAFKKIGLRDCSQS